MSFRKYVKVGFLALLLGAAILVSVQVLTVEALVPSIVSLDFYSVGSETWVNITINHTPPPALGSGHYVSVVQLEINGTVQDLPQSPQSTNTFVVQHSVGATDDFYVVRARALCNVHGYSTWSNQATIPEYSLPVAVLFIAFATIAVVAAKKTLGRRASVVI